MGLSAVGNEHVKYGATQFELRHKEKLNGVINVCE